MSMRSVGKGHHHTASNKTALKGWLGSIMKRTTLHMETRNRISRHPVGDSRVPDCLPSQLSAGVSENHCIFPNLYKTKKKKNYSAHL